MTIGIDVGGTKLRAIRWNGRRVIRAVEEPTSKNEADFVKTIRALVRNLDQESGGARIAIGAAGIVEKTTLLSSPNIPFIAHFDFKTLWDYPTVLRLDNDARCFARAEFLTGAGRGAKRLFALTIGTGVGRAYVKNGKIVRDKRLEPPETWEPEYQAVRDQGDDSKLASFLGEKLLRLLESVAPDVIVVGGGVTERRGFLRKFRRELVLRGIHGKVNRAALGKNAVAIGAVLLLD